MQNKLCVLCHHPFLEQGKHCPQCRRIGLHTRARYRRDVGLPDDGANSDNKNTMGKGAGSVRWVKVVYCPKDDDEDEFPPFMPGKSKFPYDQFLVGLTNETWPVGMKVDVTYLRYSKGREGKAREIYKRHKEYTITEQWGKLVEKLERDRKRFVKQARERFGE